MMRWMINCKEHSILTSENMDRTLSLWERFSVWLHQVVCPPCSQFRKQLETIRAACREAQLNDNASDPDACRLPDDVSKKMKTLVKELHAKK